VTAELSSWFVLFQSGKRYKPTQFGTRRRESGMTPPHSYSGYLVALSDLPNLLASIAHGSKRWWVDENAPYEWVDGNWMITVVHSNPSEGQVTDEISFLVQVIPLGTPRSTKLYACFDGNLIRPKMEGLYFERDLVLLDAMEDAHSFFGLLLPALIAYAEKGLLTPCDKNLRTLPQAP
jgi:hypothetical protein